MIGDGHQARQQPEDTAERRITWWQRALRWVAWLTFLGLAIWKSGSATVGEVFKDIGIFIEDWIVERTFRLYDAELENTHAYALFILLLPGLLLLWFNLVPLLNRGSEFQVDPDGSVSVRRGERREPLMDYQYSTVEADGTTISSRHLLTARLPSRCRSIACSPGSTGHGSTARSAPSSSGGCFPAAASRSRHRRRAAALAPDESKSSALGQT